MTVKGYLVFHHNLLFSSVPESHYSHIIDTVYSRILDICESGVKMGLEFNGLTLEKIDTLNPGYIKRLKHLLDSGQAELIGSSYTQAVMPLIPYEVNLKNIEIGREIYSQKLSAEPECCLPSEMVVSEGSLELLKQCGYQSFIVDYLNVLKSSSMLNNQVEKWMPSTCQGLDILWADTVLSQKFQRTIWGDIDFEDYFKYLDGLQKHSILPVYCGDAEIFEYIPGTLTMSKNGKDFSRMGQLLSMLSDRDMVSFVCPSEVINELGQKQDITITSSEFPVITKKQDKYNLTRWAVTGRDSTRMNSQCYHIYKSIKDKKDSDMWKELCYLFSSDFRTNTTDEKYLEFRNRVGACMRTLESSSDKSKSEMTVSNRFQTRESGRYFELETDNVTLKLIKNKGLAIDSLVLKEKSTSSLLGTLPHGYFNDISFAADFYSLHTVIVEQSGKQVTDLSTSVGDISVNEDTSGIHIIHNGPLEMKGVSLSKEFVVNENTVKVRIHMYFDSLHPVSLRTGIITLNPRAFDPDSMYYKTVNGGKTWETYTLNKGQISHSDPVSHLVSASGCLGATTGQIAFGDKNRELMLTTPKHLEYTVPLISFHSVDNLPFLRVMYSMCERDDVACQFFKGYRVFEIDIS